MRQTRQAMENVVKASTTILPPERRLKRSLRIPTALPASQPYWTYSPNATASTPGGKALTITSSHHALLSIPPLPLPPQACHATPRHPAAHSRDCVNLLKKQPAPKINKRHRRVQSRSTNFFSLFRASLVAQSIPSHLPVVKCSPRSKEKAVPWPDIDLQKNPAHR